MMEKPHRTSRYGIEPTTREWPYNKTAKMQMGCQRNGLVRLLAYADRTEALENKYRYRFANGTPKAV